MTTESTTKNASAASDESHPYQFGPARLMAYSVGLVLVGAAGPMLGNSLSGPGVVVLATAIMLLAVSLYLGLRSA